MSQVSRPVQILLIATLLFAAVWFVALRPKGTQEEVASTPVTQEAPAAPGTSGLTGAIDEAERAVAESNGASQGAEQSGGASAQPDASSGSGGGNQGSGGGSPGKARASTAPVRSAREALRAHKAIAIAFVDPSTADARAVARELRGVSDFGGRAYLQSVPLANVADYGFITNGVEITVAPTVVIVAPDRTATTIVGFSDRGEIEQRLADALRS